MSNKFYEHANDQHLRKIVFYANSENKANNLLYHDPACTEKTTNEELRDAFVKGLMLISVTTNPNDNYVVPVACLNNGYMSVAMSGDVMKFVNWNASAT